MYDDVLLFFFLHLFLSSECIHARRRIARIACAACVLFFSFLLVDGQVMWCSKKSSRQECVLLPNEQRIYTLLYEITLVNRVTVILHKYLNEA